MRCRCGLIQELTWALTWEDTFVRLIAKTSDVDFAEAREFVTNSEFTAEGRAWLARNLNMFVTIGASGAIYGILLAFGMLFPNAPLYLFSFRCPSRPSGW